MANSSVTRAGPPHSTRPARRTARSSSLRSSASRSSDCIPQSVSDDDDLNAPSSADPVDSATLNAPACARAAFVTPVELVQVKIKRARCAGPMAAVRSRSPSACSASAPLAPGSHGGFLAILPPPPSAQWAWHAPAARLKALGRAGVQDGAPHHACEPRSVGGALTRPAAPCNWQL